MRVFVAVVVVVSCCHIKKQPNKMQALSFVHFQIEDFPKDAELAQRMQAARARAWRFMTLIKPQLFCNIENERNFETCFFWNHQVLSY